MTQTCHHFWEPNPAPRDTTEAWACADCPATAATCIQCQRSSGNAIPLCPGCQHHVERTLDRLEQYLAIATLSEALKSDVRSPMDYRVRVNGSKSEVEVTSTEDIYDAMLSWAAMWTEHTKPEPVGPIAYLRSRLIWAATYPLLSAWADFVDEARQYRRVAQELAGLGPLRLPESCIECDGDLVQDRCDPRGDPYPDGLQDEVRCVVCDRRWDDRQHYQLVVRQHLCEREDARLTRAQARQLWPDVPAVTWRRWESRGMLAVEGGTYRVGDIRDRVSQWRADARTGA